jgi:hypothetical protein
VRTATSIKPGLLSRIRNAYRRSWTNEAMAPP